MRSVCQAAGESLVERQSSTEVETNTVSVGETMGISHTKVLTASLKSACDEPCAAGRWTDGETQPTCPASHALHVRWLIPKNPLERCRGAPAAAAGGRRLDHGVFIVDQTP